MNQNKNKQVKSPRKATRPNDIKDDVSVVTNTKTDKKNIPKMITQGSTSTLGDTERARLDKESFAEYFHHLSETGRKIRKADKYLQESDPKEVEMFNRYIHTAGVELLRLQSLEEFESSHHEVTISRRRYDLTEQRNQHKESRMNTYKKLGHMIKVNDMEEDGLTALIDNELNTRFWTSDMILSATEALLLIFSNPDLETSIKKKEHALVMMKTLMNRHRLADIHVQKNIETMIAKLTNCSINQGKVSGLLDLVHIFHMFRERYLDDISKHNFCGYVFDLLLLEMRLAAIIIQNAFRMKYQRMKGQQNSTTSHGFHDSIEYMKLQEEAIKTRKRDLNHRWRKMHWSSASSKRSSRFHIIGLPHIPALHVQLFLETILTCVSTLSIKYLESNREIILQLCGEIFLSKYVACPLSLYANVSMAILMNISYLSESFFPCLQCGSVLATRNFFAYHLQQLTSLTAMRSDTPAPHRSIDKSSPSNKMARKKVSVVASSPMERSQGEKDLEQRIERSIYMMELAIKFLTNMCSHEAAMYHQNKHNTSKSSSSISSKNNSSKSNDSLQNISSSSSSSMCMDDIVPHNSIVDGHPKQSKTALIEHIYDIPEYPSLLSLLSDLTISTNNLSTIKLLLKCMLCMTDSPCQEYLLSTMTSNASRLLQRLIEFLEESNQEISVLAFCILLQCCSTYPNRNRLQQYIHNFLSPIIECSNVYDRPSYQRGIYVAIALCRQHLWEFRHPESLLDEYSSWNSHYMHQKICETLLISMKYDSNRVITSNQEKTSLSMNNLLLQSNQSTACRNISLQVHEMNLSKYLCDYFSHPNDISFAQSLSWSEMCCHCMILECLSINPLTARMSFSSGCISFIMKCFHISRYHFFGNPIPDYEARIILTGIISAARYLCNICHACQMNQSNLFDIISCVEYYAVDTHINMDAYIYDIDQQGKPIRSDIIDATCFFLNTLNMSSNSLPSAMLKSLQIELVLSILGFYYSYANLIQNISGKSVRNKSRSICSEWEEIVMNIEKGDASFANIDKHMKYMNQPGRAMTKVRSRR